jgi:hypothetical protein
MVINVSNEPATSTFRVEELLSYLRKYKHNLEGWDVCMLTAAKQSVAQLKPNSSVSVYGLVPCCCEYVNEPSGYTKERRFIYCRSDY